MNNSVISNVVRNPQPDDGGGFLAPQAPLEMTTWVICEICGKIFPEVQHFGESSV